MKARRKKESLRPDTTLAPVGKPEAEVYVWGMPVCCLAAFKEAVVGGTGDDRRLLELRCSCGQGWHVTSSLDEHVLGRFVTLEPSAVGNQLAARPRGPKASG